MNTVEDQHKSTAEQKIGATSEPLVRVKNATKRYPGTVALDSVDYEVYPGSVNVLIGENGAGKSTLMKLLAGAERPTEGEILVKGKSVYFHGVRDAEKSGIGIIFQELNLFPDMSIAENLFIGNEIRHAGTIDTRAQYRKAKQLLERVGLDIDPATRIGDLYVGQQQLVEIARMLSRDVDVLIMDEPTSALSLTEVEVLFGIIESLRQEGVAVIYISHRLEEIMRIGDHITVLRNGRIVGVDLVENIDISWIVRQMVGGEHKIFDYRPRQIGEPILRVKDLSLKRINGTLALDKVNFGVGRGEIIGIYGLMGSGRTELMEVLLGLHRSALGDIEFDGKPLAKAKPANRIKAGIALVPEDRQTAGMIQPMSVRDNMTLSSIGRCCSRFLGFRMIRGKVEKQQSQSMVSTLGIKVSNDTDYITTLSGGNMQKVIIGKALLTEPRVLLFDEPTRGVDVGAKADIYRAMNNIADQGVAIIYTTSELDEALAVSDRILVMASGQITADLPRDQVDRDIITQKASPSAARETAAAQQGARS
ncbi:sugar ABC transporter ATP-binding protein [Halomonas elongata]|uniref:ABC-type transport system ATP-binding protein n=1 Tax=Halomonas elongata (strain ATCC 33173 / DSM 2581 / NBRC 15536 / NCIMB 2198 / 1H9) TaxID=768066 RepID=E1V9W5_HALED|nr:sugar ABC transporter ATP-binding protein [Halomonas elongata]WBF17590.1 sugar ABC transporter ATP-binding protein [Halomonas elongata]WPU46429.1 sugar ABC transporter ATP-binding protein [Halomonas elongata DSM 2581]WVI71221.1 sugar ABC transporter ATP-binding protein [Halomonas elongata]CBV43853.1 ABC-type transport system ATP-binding protein [Halomonas elongata DSM 2581]